tara:strand:+ start:2133 stop:2279 length:147 start_codon:yes stop_codon:yes gene_type:complete
MSRSQKALLARMLSALILSIARPCSRSKETAWSLRIPRMEMRLQCFGA